MIFKYTQKNSFNNLICRKIEADYFNKIGISVSKAKAYNVIRDQLGFSFLKTSIKNVRKFWKKNEIENGLRLNYRKN